MIAKYGFDVKLKIRLSSYAVTFVPACPPTPGFPVIDPTEALSPSFLSLQHTALYAVFAQTNVHGEVTQECEDQSYVIKIPRSACQMLAPNIWIATANDGIDHAGSVLQAFAPGNRLLETIGNNPEKNRWLKELGKPPIVVSAFQSDMVGAHRAMDHAAQHELSDIEYIRSLREVSNEALSHALFNNLREDISLNMHLANVDELEFFAQASSSDVADEIRAFLCAIRSPKDRIDRYNTYRMVLIVRAVQRRAKRIVAAKEGRVLEIIAARSAAAMYIGDVTATAHRAASILEDHQPWWTGNDTLPKYVSDQRRRNFVTRLSGYAEQLHEIHANPFRPWARLAAQEISMMAINIRSERYEDVGGRSLLARSYLGAIRVQELASQAILSVRNNDGTNVAYEAFEASIAWSLQSMPQREFLRFTRDVVSNAQHGQRSHVPELQIEHLRSVEQTMFQLGTAVAEPLTA